TSNVDLENLAALSSIYGDKWCVIDEAVIVSLNGAWLWGPDRRALFNSLEELYMYVQCIYEELPPIKHGGMITDRRSTFLPQLPTVVTTRQLLCRMLDMLYRYQPSTNPSPFYCLYCRIYCEDKQSFLQDREDDGDTAAGGQLLHLLQILDVPKVVVSCWYGGILLGPDISNTSTTLPETSWTRRDTLPLQ
uniref:Impact RWD domain protein n=1 Tax=Hucho hucho TaxID=62062 RepID=A0A4W5NPV6_9TELE